MNSFLKRRIVLIEAMTQVRESYKYVLQNYSDFIVVGDYSSFDEAAHVLKIKKPEIVLMDVAIDGGVEFIKHLKATFPFMNVLILTSCTDADVVFASLRAGAAGFLLKDSNYNQVVFALNEFLRGGGPLSSTIARIIVSSFRVNSDSPLTKRETEILNQLATGKTHSQIAEKFEISCETSKKHTRNIYKKLQVTRKSEAINFAYENNYIVAAHEHSPR